MDSEEDTGGVFMGTLSYPELEATIRLLLKKYHAEYALLFGSYARGEATRAEIHAAAELVRQAYQSVQEAV